MASSPMIANHSSLLAASHSVASALAPTGAAKANTTTGTTGTGATSAASTADTSDPSTITSSDFLTLLVSELQNQDPTQPTDPNAYISQLVGVNSLQQLISIDQGITSLSSAASTSSSAAAATSAAIGATTSPMAAATSPTTDPDPGSGQAATTSMPAS